MKRIAALFLMLVVLVGFAGCRTSGLNTTQDTTPLTQPTEPIDPNVLSKEPPSQEVRKEMYEVLLEMGHKVNLENYPKACPNRAWYYGTINGCIVAFGDPGQMTVVRSICVADCVFRYGYPFHIFVYRDGEACELQEAYENGWLTKEHIKQLEIRHIEVLKELRQAWDELYESLEDTQDG